MLKIMNMKIRMDKLFQVNLEMHRYQNNIELKKILSEKT